MEPARTEAVLAREGLEFIVFLVWRYAARAPIAGRNPDLGHLEGPVQVEEPEEVAAPFVPRRDEVQIIVAAVHDLVLRDFAGRLRKIDKLARGSLADHMGRAVPNGIPEPLDRHGRTLRRNPPMPGLGAFAWLDHGRRALAGRFSRGGFPAIARAKTIASRTDGPRRGQLVAISVEIAADEHRSAGLAEPKSARILPVLRKRRIRVEVAIGVVCEKSLVRKAIAAELVAFVRAFLQHGASVAEAVQHEEP